MISQATLREWFRYHAPSEHPDGLAVVQGRYERLRAAGLVFAEAIVAETPACADQTAAVRKVREAVMTANAAIACNGV